MKRLIFLLLIFTIYGCSKPKTVLICGDHVCINKAEANQYFEDNLTLEVRIIDSKNINETNLVQINLKTNPDGKKEVNVLDKKQSNKELKELSVFEIKKKKKDLRERKIAKKKIDKKSKISKQTKQTKLTKDKKVEKTQLQIVNKKKENEERVVKRAIKQVKKIDDICTILEKCNIDEITKYLVNQGKKKNYPDIANRENK
ncbi:hypothetical protein OAA54_02565 [Pelagibacteraceae bacterium]|nr:hypothetical protein [Pelagibacteraceae bacterium]